ncbi:MAG TPA: Stp1/IreP family PP2C-type Ser/Thr phosphatase [Burkholderiales bacterium]|nr:Stp1/IreP family PP2C-type Ser/Thr phosphatase [Burkholderiales bacterium]
MSALERVFMDQSKALEIVTATDPGMVRSHNEDSIAVDAASGYVILADGMGGYNAGEVASGIATAMLGTSLKQILEGAEPGRVEPASGDTQAVRILREQIAGANASIYQAAKSQPQYAGMGTTLLVGLFYDRHLSVAHLGDSRLYRLRRDELKQITRDHSLLQEQIDSGMITQEMARFSLNRNLVTRALGIDPEVEPEIHTYEVEVGDLYLLCSDGLSDMVEDDEIQLTLSSLQANLPLASQQLVQLANDNGGRDNISVILVRILRHLPVGADWISRLSSWFRLARV